MTDRRLARTRANLAAQRAGFVGRLLRLCGRQISALEKRTKEMPSEGEQNARHVAAITRALEGLIKLEERDREMTRRKKTNEHAQTPEQAIPRDTEELERSLARKLEAIIAGTEDTVSRESEQP